MGSHLPDCKSPAPTQTVTFPRRLWVIRVPGTLSYQVCKDDEELSTPYISLAEHEALLSPAVSEEKCRHDRAEELEAVLWNIAHPPKGCAPDWGQKIAKAVLSEKARPDRNKDG
jgi:hypothetical protein